MDYCRRAGYKTYNQYRADPTYNQHLLTSLRESIVDKPPYISGTLQLPDSFFSLFYKSAKDGNAARFEDEVS